MHSPYAYRFVIDVLRPGPYRYYSYHEVDRLLNNAEYHDFKFIKLIRFTIRLANFLKSQRIVAAPSSKRLCEIVASAMHFPYVLLNDEKEENELSEGDLFIFDSTILRGSSGEFDFLRKAIERGTSIFALNPSEDYRELLETPIKKGLLLRDNDRIILIPRQEMEYVVYDMILSLKP